MSEKTLDRAALEALVMRFTDAFNDNDLDGVMSMIAEDAIYDEFTGTRHVGRRAIREAFVPQFRGDYGKMRFHAEDLFVDPVAGRALISWLCTLDTKRGPAGWRGLDILHVKNGLVTEKHTYAKAKAPLLTETAAKG